MTTKYSIRSGNRQILQFLYRYKHMTAEDIHHYLFPEATRRSVERRLSYLLNQGLIDAHTHRRSTAGRSPRLYHLLLAGASQIGQTTLGNQNYRRQREDFRQYALGLVELRHLAATYNWPLYETEEDCQQVLYAFYAAAGTTEASLIIPSRVTPDAILSTDDGAVNICLRGHPHAGRGFWAARLKKYRALLRKCRAIAVVLDECQRGDAQAAVKRYELERRVLVTDLKGLRELPELVQRAKQAARP